MFKLNYDLVTIQVLHASKQDLKQKLVITLEEIFQRIGLGLFNVSL